MVPRIVEEVGREPPDTVVQERIAHDAIINDGDSDMKQSLSFANDNHNTNDNSNENDDNALGIIWSSIVAPTIFYSTMNDENESESESEYIDNDGGNNENVESELDYSDDDDDEDDGYNSDEDEDLQAVPSPNHTLGFVWSCNFAPAILPSMKTLIIYTSRCAKGICSSVSSENECNSRSCCFVHLFAKVIIVVIQISITQCRMKRASEIRAT